MSVVLFVVPLKIALWLKISNLLVHIDAPPRTHTHTRACGRSQYCRAIHTEAEAEEKFLPLRKILSIGFARKQKYGGQAWFIAVNQV
jgi:hypothetical protein